MWHHWPRQTVYCSQRRRLPSLPGWNSGKQEGHHWSPGYRSFFQQKRRGGFPAQMATQRGSGSGLEGPVLDLYRTGFPLDPDLCLQIVSRLAMLAQPWCSAAPRLQLWGRRSYLPCLKQAPHPSTSLTRWRVGSTSLSLLSCPCAVPDSIHTACTLYWHCASRMTWKSCM